MKSIKLPSGNTATVPEGWHEVSVKQALAMDKYPEYRDVLEFGLDRHGRHAAQKGFILSVVVPEYNSVAKFKAMPMDDAIALMAATAWIDEPAEPAEIGKTITLNGKRYKVCTDFNDLTIMQYRMMQDLSKAAQNHEDNTELAMNFAALMIRPADCKAWSMEVMEANIEALEYATVTELAGLSAFFLHTQSMRLIAMLPYTARAPMEAIMRAKRYTSNTGGGISWLSWPKAVMARLSTLSSNLLTRFSPCFAFGRKRPHFNELRTNS